MLDHDSPYDDRSPDLIARVRKMREAAREQMDKFGDLAEYDVEILRGNKTPEGTRSEAAIDSTTASTWEGAKP